MLKECVMSSFDHCNKMSGRRMGGNNILALERICAQCQGKVAHFEIVRIKDFNVYKETTSAHTHSYTLFVQHKYTRSSVVHITYTLQCLLLYKNVEWKTVYI